MVAGSKASILLWALLAGLSGCAAMELGREATNKASRDKPAATRWGRETVTAADIAGFDEAKGLTMDLRYEEAVRRLSRLLPVFERAGDRRRAGEIKFWTGYCYEKLGRPDDAAAFYRAVIHGHGDGRAALHARARLGAMPRRP